MYAVVQAAAVARDAAAAKAAARARAEGDGRAGALRAQLDAKLREAYRVDLASVMVRPPPKGPFVFVVTDAAQTHPPPVPGRDRRNVTFAAETAQERDSTSLAEVSAVDEAWEDIDLDDEDEDDF